MSKLLNLRFNGEKILSLLGFPLNPPPLATSTGLTVISPTSNSTYTESVPRTYSAGDLGLSLTSRCKPDLSLDNPKHPQLQLRRNLLLHVDSQPLLLSLLSMKFKSAGKCSRRPMRKKYLLMKSLSRLRMLAHSKNKSLSVTDLSNLSLTTNAAEFP